MTGINALVKLRAELVQVAAVAVAYLEALMDAAESIGTEGLGSSVSLLTSPERLSGEA